ncbi:hypothetical protein ACFY1L_49000 [Streptomyces sp. NPDC001663]
MSTHYGGVTLGAGTADTSIRAAQLGKTTRLRSGFRAPRLRPVDVAVWQ